MSGQDDVVWYLRITEEDLGQVVVLTVVGRVFSQTVSDFAARLARVTSGERRRLIVDFSAVDYINSEGLRTLEAAAKRVRSSRGELVVCGLTLVVRTAFDLAGSIAHLAIEPSREAAVRNFSERD
ncbi:MAG TPA: STAS domain-containing protein [Vicinamibacterales bacterium]